MEVIQIAEALNTLKETKSTKGKNPVRTLKNFDEIKALWTEAEEKQKQITIFETKIKQLREIILKDKSTKMNVEANGEISSEQDEECYIVTIEKENKYSRNETICTFSNLELIKNCCSLVARTAEKAKTQKEQELKQILENIQIF